MSSKSETDKDSKLDRLNSHGNVTMEEALAALEALYGQDSPLMKPFLTAYFFEIKNLGKRKLFVERQIFADCFIYT